MAADGQYVADDPRGTYALVQAVTFSSPDIALVVDCLYDALVILGPAGTDGQPTVVNEAAISTKYGHTVFLESGEWRVGEAQKVDALGEGDLCDG